ncbi:MAG: DUF5675 family protein [Bacteroidales bacterium]|nr:DUF5675 family protein [Bacteroidales bacterium]
MEIIINRKWPRKGYTIGTLSIDGVRICESLEDEDRGLKQGMSLAEIQKRKVYGETAIPAGRYLVTMTVSPKFRSRAWAVPYGGKVPLINNVTGYDGVRIHPMNRAEDSLGCVGVGRNTIKGQVTNSTYWYRYILDNYIIPATKRKEAIYLTIM